MYASCGTTCHELTFDVMMMLGLSRSYLLWQDEEDRFWDCILDNYPEGDYGSSGFPISSTVATGFAPVGESNLYWELMQQELADESQDLPPLEEEQELHGSDMRQCRPRRVRNGDDTNVVRSIESNIPHEVRSCLPKSQ